MAYTYRLVKGSPLTHAEYDENFFTVDEQYNAALEAAEMAEKWAEEAEDTEVVTGAYSAFHWAQKAAESVGSITDEVAQAEAARDAAEGFATDSQTYAGQSMGYRDQAEGYKNDAQTYAGNASTSADLAEDWAIQPEDTEVTPGNYSALHWAAKADAEAVAALSAKTDAEAARDKAQDWAEEVEDTEVEPGMYSSKHHAAKAAASASAASGFADDAAASAATAESEVTDALNPIQSYSEKQTMATWNSTSQTIDLSTGSVHFRILSGVNITSLSFTNVPTTGAVSLTLILEQDSSIRSINWPASVLWSGGTEPALDTADQYYVLTFLTINGGTTWLGFESGGDFA